MAYQSVNPYDGKILKTFKELTDNQLETALGNAATCFENWRHTTFALARQYPTHVEIQSERQAAVRAWERQTREEQGEARLQREPAAVTQGRAFSAKKRSATPAPQARWNWLAKLHALERHVRRVVLSLAAPAIATIHRGAAALYRKK